MTAAPAEVHPHYEAIWSTLDGIPDLTAYDGRVAPSPPLGSDKRVLPYAVLYMGSGRPVAVNMCRAYTHLDLKWQVTVVGGDQQRVMRARDWVIAAYVGRRLVVSGRASGLIRLLEQREVACDEDVEPPRFFVPLLFGCSTNPT